MMRGILENRSYRSHELHAAGWAKAARTLQFRHDVFPPLPTRSNLKASDNVGKGGTRAAR
jgi:hypothetical protein